jgi:hypothetical protein
MADDMEFHASLKFSHDVESALEIARAAGFDVTHDDVIDFLGAEEQPLADDQLEDLSGGRHGQYLWKTGCCSPKLALSIFKNF